MNTGTIKNKAFRILIVDDDNLMRFIVPKALRNLEVSVDVAENGLQAQEMIRAGNYDLVITDFRMPLMDGLELLHWLQKNHPAIEGIVMTGQDYIGVLSHEELGGFADYLPKPFPIHQLQESVRNSMNRLKGRGQNP